MNFVIRNSTTQCPTLKYNVQQCTTEYCSVLLRNATFSLHTRIFICSQFTHSAGSSVKYICATTTTTTTTTKNKLLAENRNVSYEHIWMHNSWDATLTWLRPKKVNMAIIGAAAAKTSKCFRILFRSNPCNRYKEELLHMVYPDQ